MGLTARRPPREVGLIQCVGQAIVSPLPRLDGHAGQGSGSVAIAVDIGQEKRVVSSGAAD